MTHQGAYADLSWFPTADGRGDVEVTKSGRVLLENVTLTEASDAFGGAWITARKAPKTSAN